MSAVPPEPALAGAAAPAQGRLAVAWVRALRPKQWTKNVFVFAAIVFAGKLFDGPAWVHTLAAFAIFSAVASAVYLVNDVADRAADALHPTKRLRPIAAGLVSPTQALITAAVLAGAGLWSALLLSHELFWIVVIYLAQSAAYNLGLKRQFLVDAMLVAFGFVLRAVAGAAAIGVEISAWLLCCTFLLALFLSFGKRRHELALLGEGASAHRSALGQYSLTMLDSWIGSLAAASIVCYALYTQAARTVEHFRTTQLILTLPFVIYGLFRYQHLVMREDRGGDPGAVLLKDKGMILAVVGWALTAAVVIYRGAL
jgi:4-hydroxybenzoate polyprenyltransferase